MPNMHGEPIWSDLSAAAQKILMSLWAEADLSPTPGEEDSDMAELGGCLRAGPWSTGNTRQEIAACTELAAADDVQAVLALREAMGLSMFV